MGLEQMGPDERTHLWPVEVVYESLLEAGGGIGMGTTFSPSSIGINCPESSAWAEISSSLSESPVKSMTSTGGRFSLSSDDLGIKGDDAIGGVA